MYCSDNQISECSSQMLYFTNGVDWSACGGNQVIEKCGREGCSKTCSVLRVTPLLVRSSPLGYLHDRDEWKEHHVGGGWQHGARWMVNTSYLVWHRWSCLYLSDWAIAMLEILAFIVKSWHKVLNMELSQIWVVLIKFMYWCLNCVFTF